VIFAAFRVKSFRFQWSADLLPATPRACHAGAHRAVVRVARRLRADRAHEPRHGDASRRGVRAERGDDLDVSDAVGPGAGGLLIPRLDYRPAITLYSVLGLAVTILVGLRWRSVLWRARG
jgi:hypothetical protein